MLRCGLEDTVYDISPSGPSSLSVEVPSLMKKLQIEPQKGIWAYSFVLLRDT